MRETDDIELLRQYAQGGSEEAFAELVARYVNLVYSVALRHVRNPHHAQEIAQAVFLILAKKAAGLRNGTILAGWLHQTARLTAANFLRREIHRAQREQEAHMQSRLNEPESEVWPQLAPFLDTAIAGLSQKDRDAVLLRFFEGRRLSEVGAALGTSEEAAKKRVNRAIEKLRGFFTKHGLVLSATALTAAISANSVQAAPASLAASISAAAAKGAVVSSSTLTLIQGVLKLMAWTKAKTAVVGSVALLFFAGTATVTVKEIQQQRTDPAADGMPSWMHNPLFMAARAGDLDKVKELLDAQPARINERVGDGLATSLHIAAYHGRAGVVEEFLRRGADVNIRTKAGHTVLYDCVYNEGTPEIALMLLEHGADVTIPDNTGKTPLRIAIQKHRDDMAALLRQHGAK